ncbi:MAG: RagB/SusD family nutrient uptake outer membrane protein [Marinifilaceae bacterium]
MAFGCQDYLNLKPTNYISLETTKDVNNLMSSYLYGISNKGWSGTPSVSMDGVSVDFPYHVGVTTNLMFCADNIIMKDIPNVSYTWNYFEKDYYQGVDWKPYDFSKSYWVDCYRNIGFFNVVMDALNKNVDVSSTEYKETYCEAKMLRAMMFFEVLKFYSPYKNINLGIPINTSSVSIEGGKRSSQKQSYDFIISELNSVLKMKFSPTEFNVFYSENHMYALLAQVYWYKAESGSKEASDWNNALKFAKKSLEGRTLTRTASQLKSLFTSNKIGFNLHNQYSLLILSSARQSSSNVCAPWGFGSDKIPVNKDFIKLFDKEDIRLEAYFNDHMQIEKWEQNFTVSNIIPLWRNAEMQLIIAEAYARMNNKSEAKKALNKFKKNRIKGFTSYNKSDVLDEILRERRKEFCFEFGYRWLDLRRVEKGFSRIGVSDKVLNSNANKVKFTLKDNDYRFTLPIPLDEELKVNDHLEQNPGWGMI